MTNSYLGKNYIVTGGSSGIGREVCIQLAEKGANVVLLGRNEERLQQTLQKMNAGHHKCISFDVSEIEKIQNLMTSLVEEYSAFDGFAYCSGIGGSTRLRDMSFEWIHRIMRVNFYGFIEFVRCLSRTAKKSHPMQIVGLSSLASSTHEKYYLAYAASKAAMESAVKTLATELVRRNMSICTIRPGFVDTPMLDTMHSYTGDFNDYIKKTEYQPTGLIPPSNIADMVIYLLSDKGRYFTGSCVPVTGGAAF